ncbi:MAG: ATP synthase F1 subunit delta [Fimbriimonadaceae bacterium]|nr:ATP synthase F1 subunit delta [Fimbriimonadaceae bacterium]
MDNRVAKRYAQALFNTALKNDVVAAVEDDMAAIAGMIANDDRFRNFLLSPNVARDERAKIAEKLFSDRITALTMQALRLMIAKRREREVEGVYDEFLRLRREHEQALRAVFTSSVELSDAEKKALVEKFASKSGKKVEPEFKVDPSVLGGVKVAFGNYVLDGTVSGSLARLRDTLLYDVLKQN